MVATPYYNASIGQDLVSEINESLCNEIFEENPNLRDALLLLKIWLHQRELDEVIYTLIHVLLKEDGM